MRSFSWRRKSCEQEGRNGNREKSADPQNDIVKVITGREKGKVGRVLKIDREKGGSSSRNSTW